MTISVTHTKVSSVPDGADTSLVRPSDWNASHTLSGVGTMAEQDASNVAITGGSVNGTSLGATTAASAKVTTLDIGSGLTLATSAGTAGQVLTSAGAGNVPTWSTNGAGDVVGPASSTDNAVARYDSTTGKLIQNSVVIVDDTGSVTGVNALTAESLVINNNATLGSSNTDTLEINARITTDLEPNADAAKDVGTSGRNWRDGFFSRNLQAEGKLVSPHFDALNSAGGQLRNSGGTPQLQWGGGGGNNISVDVATNLNPANAQIDISPTGTGTVRINPATASSMNNVVIGASTPLAGTFTDLGVTGTLSFDSAQGSSGQVLTSQGSGVTPIWTTPTTGTVTSVSGTAPISSSGGATPAISISQATTSTDGYLSSTDWNTFNGKAPLASPTFTGTVTLPSNTIVNGFNETITVTASAPSSTTNFDVVSQSIQYYTSNTANNWTLNIRGNSGTSLNTLMATGQSITITFLATNDSTAYYNSAVTIDGNAITPKWQGGTAPSTGNASAVDIYTYAIVKTGSAAFTVFASITKFA
jgi:hypothetical protein